MQRILAIGLATLAVLLMGMLTWHGGADRSGGEDDYARADRRALAAPPSATATVAALAAYLARGAHSQREIARAIFRWIAANVAYDAPAFFSGRLRDTALHAEDVLARRRAVCDGFARLFDALARAAGLQSHIVTGWAKGWGYTPGAPLAGEPNHAWNAVELDGRWYLVDPTWGAGVVDEASRRFVREFDDGYFLAPPGQFVYEHLPEDPRWQLLEHPLNARAFAARAYLRPRFFRAGLRLESHDQAVLRVTDRAEVTLGLTRDVLVTAALYRGHKRLPASRVFVQQARSAVRVQAVAPAAGDYLLRIYSKPRGDAGPYHWAMEYRVLARRAAPRHSVFPEAYEDFRTHGAVLDGPVQGPLSPGRAQPFRLAVPGAERVAVVSAGKWSYLARQGETFSGDALIGRGDTTVYAQFPGRRRFQGLLRYAAP